LNSHESPAQTAICPPTRTVSIPSLVRDITKRFCQIVSLSRIIGVQTPPTLTHALRATASPQMVALGELEFDKIFLTYVYLAG
jgi:RNA-dependent RNA polymerase